MKTICSALLLAAAIVAPAAEKTDSEGFVSLFNGKDLTGWEGHKHFWSVKEGTIHGQTTKENPTKGNTFLLYTNGVVDDFELRFHYKIVGGNSGMQYRSKHKGNYVVAGYQGDFEAGKTYSGILYDEAGGAGKRDIMAGRGEKVVWGEDCKKQVVGTVGKSEEIQSKIKHEDWNEYVIIAKGNHLVHKINGQTTVDVTDNCKEKRVDSGILALQLHAGPPMIVQVKEVRLKKLK